MFNFEVFIHEQFEKFKKAHPDTTELCDYQVLQRFVDQLQVECNRLRNQAPASDKIAVQEAAERGFRN